jgi:hypothetical protein
MKFGGTTMTTKTLPDIDVLRQLFLYVPETGELIWRMRDESICTDERSCNSFNSQFAGQVAGTKRKNEGNYYIQVQILEYGQFQAHRLVWKLHYGVEPPPIIDHIDGDGLNNRIDNLREATIQQNGWNAKRNSRNKSGFKGVSFNTEKNKWRAAIHVHGKTKLIGYFSTPDAAGEAYKKEAAILHGDFIRV